MFSLYAVASHIHFSTQELFANHSLLEAKAHKVSTDIAGVFSFRSFFKKIRTITVGLDFIF